MILNCLLQRHLSERSSIVQEKNRNWNLRIKIWNVIHHQHITVLHINKDSEGLFGLNQHKWVIVVMLKVSVIKFVAIGIATEDASCCVRCTLQGNWASHFAI